VENRNISTVTTEIKNIVLDECPNFYDFSKKSQEFVIEQLFVGEDINRIIEYMEVTNRKENIK